MDEPGERAAAVGVAFQAQRRNPQQTDRVFDLFRIDRTGGCGKTQA